jgi:Cu/Ag efflux protein CusF
MNKTLVAIAVSAAALPVLAQAPAKAPAKPAAPKQAADTQAVTLVGTIEAIDSTAREVTLKIDGELYSFTAGPEVKRFSELKVGQKLTAEYREAVLYEIRQPGASAPAAAFGGQASGVRGKAVKPSGAIVRQQVASVVVTAIDPKTPSITILTNDARTVTVRVEHPERLKAVKVGDKIDITYTQAFQVRIE